ncbi:DUF4145 domain-containing protein, partial [Acinetobacter sp. ABJ_C5_2]|uniref:DUF4145 domain-containing protein n=1 Tax=Acinetobacter sp. ABJ_C5_2 TaxID=3376992 RepID=UPI0037C7F319
MDEKIKKILTQCLDCKRETNHEIIATKLYETYIPYEYHDGKEYSIVQCRGCDQVSFLKTYHDYESIYPTGYNDDFEHVRSYTNYYPDASQILTKYKRSLPKDLYTIYSETKVAFTQNLNIFTAIGIRSIIECICKDKKVIGKNLEKKISNLKNLGDISKRDVDLLHSLRFLGNDAVHELIKPEENDVKVAFDIIEHLIQAIYLMPKELKNTNFKVHLDEYTKFENFIIEMIRNHIGFDFSYNYSIKKLVSPRGKIPYGKFSEFEQELNSRINSGDIDWIEIVSNEAQSSESQND